MRWWVWVCRDGGWERWTGFHHIFLLQCCDLNRTLMNCTEYAVLCTRMHIAHTIMQSKHVQINFRVIITRTCLSLVLVSPSLSTPPFVVFTLILTLILCVFFFGCCCCLLSHTWYSQSLTCTSIIRIAPWHAMNAMNWYACLLCSTRQRTIIKLLYLP